MNRTVKRLWPFSWTDYREAEVYLEQQAAKGLLLKKMRTIGWSGNIGVIAEFERGAPQKRKYCIDVFSVPLEERESYIQMASDSGWTLLLEIEGLGIYVSEEGGRPVPLQTDWKEQYRHIRKNFWRFEIPVAAALLALGWFVYQKESLKEPLLAAPFSLAGIFLILLFVFGLSCLIRSIGYYLATEIAIRRNIPLKPVGMGTAKAMGFMHHGLCVAVNTGILFNVIRMTANAFAEGDLLKRIALGTIFLSMIALCFIEKVKPGGKVQLKGIYIGLWTVWIIAFLTYCSAGEGIA